MEEEIDQPCRVQTLPSNADPWLSWSEVQCGMSAALTDKTRLISGRCTSQPRVGVVCPEYANDLMSMVRWWRWYARLVLVLPATFEVGNSCMLWMMQHDAAPRSDCVVADMRGKKISEAVHYRVRVRVAALLNAIRWPLYLLAVSENIFMHCAKLLHDVVSDQLVVQMEFQSPSPADVILCSRLPSIFEHHPSCALCIFQYLPYAAILQWDRFERLHVVTLLSQKNVSSFCRTMMSQPLPSLLHHQACISITSNPTASPKAKAHPGAL